MADVLVHLPDIVALLNVAEAGRKKELSPGTLTELRRCIQRKFKISRV
jgi:hypothetical protein